jgi:hypothetical protein
MPPWEIASPIIIVGSALVFVLLERLFPYEPRQKLIREGFFTDLIWDWLFGTAYLPQEKPALYGLSDSTYPKRGALAWVHQHWVAFRKRQPESAT